ncbi:flavin reductase family protein [Nocardioides sp. AE5]|uniref:flavin reductase family protein n=1 Tax=Nocardioides sp. AE5 TaxID=2962573 RepID=UPI0028827F42|nr:flavin reductase family protein [Nocardioides sp. AE5]MDT0203249.1 flavin reductase family protein [Nocardioides sp. AE5]
MAIRPHTSAALGRAVRPLHSTTPTSQFRDVMANMAAPVSVITAADDGVGSGATVSALMSLSMDPEMIVVALDRTSATLGMIQRTRRFGVNILAADQRDVAMAFASKGADKFIGLDHCLESGVPRLGGISGWVRCTVERIQPGGDHVLVSGLVERAFHDPTLEPMTYQGRSFGTHRPG